MDWFLYKRNATLKWVNARVFLNWQVDGDDDNNVLFWGVTAWKMSKYGVFSGPYFSTFGQNIERYEVSLRIQSEYGKIRTRKNSVFGHFSRSVCLSKKKTLVWFLFRKITGATFGNLKSKDTVKTIQTWESNLTIATK